MAYEKPPCSANQIDKAGKTFFNPKLATNERGQAIAQIWNWRAAHSYPLNALHTTLRNRTLKVDSTAYTAQRLKRLQSILRKLGRQSTMQMSQMQDIGGCRAVLPGMARLNTLRFIYQTSPIRHELTRSKDYISDPKDDGYRSVHLMYRFCGRASSLPWDKLRIEMQLRTKLQHAWATCVETVDAFTAEDLKFGKGTSDWRRFFQLMGSVHARLEKTPDVPGTPRTERELLQEVEDLETKLQVRRMLRDFTSVTTYITRQPQSERVWYLVQMEPTEGRVQVRGFSRDQFRVAKQKLAEMEKEYQGTRNQAVLVATGNVHELKKAYPNYFADTGYFTTVLERFLTKIRS